MRVNRKAKAASTTEAQKKLLRPCIVRLEKVRAAARTALRMPRVAKQKLVEVEEITPRRPGRPAKKRIAEEEPHSIPATRSSAAAAAASAASTSATPAQRRKAKLIEKVDEQELEEELEPPPTIAAGRSRRSIKPNPKYASEDVVTPKIMKNVGLLGSAALSNVKKSVDAERHQRQQRSSVDDFYSKDYSSDELEAIDLTDDDKPYWQATPRNKKLPETNEQGEEVSVKRARGRPKAPISTPIVKKSISITATEKTPMPRERQQIVQTTINRATIEKNKTALLAKLQPSTSEKATARQALLSLQTRKSITPQVTRIAARPTTQQVALKRKLDISPDASEKDKAANITNKRFMISAGVHLKKTVNNTRQSPQQTVGVLTSQVPAKTLNGNKLVNVSATTPPTAKLVNTTIITERKPGSYIEKHIINKALYSKSGASPTVSIVKTTQSTTPSAAKPTTNVKEVQKPNKPNIPSAAVMPTKKPDAKTDTVQIRAEAGERPPQREGMPTFTIVNVHDIINKKGDVLVSRATTFKPSAASVDDNAKPAAANAASSAAVGDDKVVRRRTLYNAMLAEKAAAESKVQTQARQSAPNVKKPTVLNHLLQKAAEAQRLAAEKPAPRILNAMVAKKTQPVKPMIANFDDSADESMPLTEDEDEDEDEEDEEEEDEEEDDDITAEDINDAPEHIASAVIPATTVKSKLAVNTAQKTALVSTKTTTTTTATAPTTDESATAATVAKENTVLTTNRIIAKTSPDKVTLSRQGDKIVKKITCFETWYVVHPPEELPEKTVPNELGMPLIRLANQAEKLQLPNNTWHSKVSLYAISPALLAKTKLTTYSGDLGEHKISEDDRHKYQPSCVMFRRAVTGNLQKTRLPYDRAVIFKNKTFFTNIEGKNVRLLGAPVVIQSFKDVEILLSIIDSQTLMSDYVELASTIQ